MDVLFFLNLLLVSFNPGNWTCSTLKVLLLFMITLQRNLDRTCHRNNDLEENKTKQQQQLFPTAQSNAPFLFTPIASILLIFFSNIKDVTRLWKTPRLNKNRSLNPLSAYEL